MPVRIPLTLIGLLAAAAVLIAAAVSARTEAAQAGPLFSLSPQHQTVALSAGTVDVQVAVASPQNVGSFQFVLRYDPGVLTPHGAAASPFLGSTGRQVQCPSPIVDGDAGPGTVQFGCATLGEQATASASGTTVMATVTFDLGGGAESAITIERDTLSDGTGLPLCVADPNAPRTDADYLSTCAAQSGSVTVSGGDPSKQQGVADTPTPVGVATEPAPTSTAVAAAPTTASVPTSVHAGVTGQGGADGSGAASGAATSGGSGQSTGVGKFGSGPPPSSHGHEHSALVAAFGAAALGLTLLAVSRRIRRHS